MERPDENTALPDGLEQQFDELESTLFRKETSGALLTAFITVLVAAGILFVSDRFWDSPVEIRSFLLIVALLGVLGAAVVWLRNWRWDPRGRVAFARLIQLRHRRFGDRLRGAVELAEGGADQPRMSPALRRAAIRQVAEGAADFDFTSVVDVTPVRRLRLVATAFAAAAVLAILLAPQAAWNSALRFLLPTAKIERFTFVRLSELPTEQVVLHGRPFDATATVTYRGLWKPRTATVRFEQQPPVEVPVTDGRLVVQLPGQTTAGRLTVKLGDASAVAEVTPTHPPVVQELTASVVYPEYLQHPPAELPVTGNNFSIVEGSRLRLRAAANRELAGVRFLTDDGEGLDLPIDGVSFESPELQPFGELRGAFDIRDQLGLTNAAPRSFLIRARPDSPPNVELLDLAPSISILESDVLPLRLFATDDFGLRLAGVAWRIVEGATNELARREMITELTNTTSVEFTNTHIFSPTVLGIPPDTTVEIRAAALDHYPEREPAQSSAYRVRVIGNLRHAQMVKEQLESLFAEVEEITRKEESIAQMTSELKNRQSQATKGGEPGEPGKPGEGKGDEAEQATEAAEAAKEAQKLAEQQEQNNRHLDSISRTGEKILEEAIRNPVISEKALKEWTENISAMQQLAKQEMKESADSLRDAQSQSQPKQQSSRKQELAKAENAQQEALQKLQEMQKQINEGLDNLEALTLAERLRSLAMKEEGIASQLRSVIVETIGLRPHELEKRHHQMNGRLSADQRKVGEESAVVQGEIGRFFDRTQKPNYGEVNREMQETKTPAALAEVGDLITGNIAMETMQTLHTWMRRLNYWAEVLEPEEEDGQGGSKGQGAQQQQQQKLIKMLLAFIRIRMNEVSLHQRTLMLNEGKSEPERVAAAAERLADQQRGIRQDLMQTQMESDFEIMKDLFFEGQNALMESEYGLLDGDAGAPTQKAQIAGIRHVSDLINLINEQAKRNRRNQQQNQQQQQAMEEMRMLMKMAQQQMRSAFQRMPGMQPGQGENGGGTGQKGEVGGGRNAENAAGQRTGDRASGRTRQIPAEFREVLERFFKAVEKEGTE